DPGPAGQRHERGHHVTQHRRGVLHQGDQPTDGAWVTLSRPSDEVGDRGRPAAPRGHAPGTRMIRASPWPPPPHSAAAPVPPPRRWSSRAKCNTIRAPDIPTGWPIAMAPPLTL